MEIKEELNSISTVFKSSEFEHSYRQQYLDQDRKQTKIIFIVTAVSIMLFIFSDYKLFGNSGMFYTLLTARSLFSLFAILLTVSLGKLSNEHTFDISTLFSVLFLSGLVLFINMTRPADYLSHSIADIAILLTIYLILPNRFIFQLISAIIFTAGNIIIIINFRSSHALLGNNIILVSYVLINLLGIIAARQMHISRRTQYELFINEKKLKEEYQNALEEIITLRGIIPICANCKQIRDDQGYWNQLEVYIQKRSLAKFSHGICPRCSKILYPEIDLHETE